MLTAYTLRTSGGGEKKKISILYVLSLQMLNKLALGFGNSKSILTFSPFSLPHESN